MPPSGSVVDPFLFVGEQGYYTDDEGIDKNDTSPLLPYYVRARFYNPAWGRWLNQDPIGFAGGDYNLYRYVFNNPLILTDPSGNISIAGGAFAGCLAGVGWSLLGSWWSEESACQATCKAVGSCLVGAVGGALATVNPAWSGCIAGVAATVINNIVGNACNYYCCGNSETDLQCAALSAVIATVGLCVGPSGTGTPSEYALGQLVGNLVNYDINGLCGFYNTLNG
jgi:RHS repeat-associated protein